MTHGQSDSEVGQPSVKSRGRSLQIALLALLGMVLSASAVIAQPGTAQPGPAQKISAPRVQAKNDPVAAANANAPAVLGRFLTIESPVTDEVIAWVRASALELQTQATSQGRRPVLVLEITPGASQFHHVYGLADLLTTQPISTIKTIAWIPQTVTGPNALVAMACDEIVMHPDASLGDLGRGQPLPEDQQLIVNGVVSKRLNPRMNKAVAAAMINPQTILLQLTLEAQPGEVEKRVVTEEEARHLREAGVVIRDSRILKERGSPGAFSGVQARNDDFLIARLAVSRRDLAESYGLGAESLREFARTNSGSARPTLIEVQGVIEHVLSAFLIRQIDRAVESGAKTIIFEIDSPGGLLYDSLELASAIADLEKLGVKTVAYVPREAISGAAIISLGCDEIYLSPNAKIGDAGPIEIAEGQVFERAPEKVLSYLTTSIETLAKRKNRPVALAKAMCDKDLDVFEVTHKEKGTRWYMSDAEIAASDGEWIKGRIVAEAQGELLLTVNGQRAHDLLLAESPVSDFDQLKERLGIPPNVVPDRAQRIWVDDLVFFLNRPGITGLLFFIAIVCIYLELHLMSGVLGLFAALCFAVFFWSKWLGGTAGGLEVMLFLFGLFCLVMEIFVLPGVGVFAVTGVLTIAASLIMASQTFSLVDDGRGFEEATQTLGSLGIALLGVGVFAMISSRFLPRIPFLNSMILTPPGAAVLAADPDRPHLRPELTAHDPLVGRIGTATTLLRPAGKAEVDGRIVEVVSDGSLIQAGTRIEVVSVRGNRIQVRELDG